MLCADVADNLTQLQSLKVPEKPEDRSILASGGYDHTVKLWNISPPVCIRTFQHPDSQVNKLEVTPDGSMLASAGHQRIRMYDLQTANPNPVVNYEGVKRNVTAIGFNANMRWMYTGGEDHSARIWDMRARSLQCQRIFQVTTPVTCVCLHPNQVELFVGDQSGTIHLWDLRNDHNEQFMPEMNSMIQSIDVDNDGTMLAAVTHRGMLYTWSLASGLVIPGVSRTHPKVKMEVHPKYTLRCRISPDSTLMVTTSADQKAKVWKTSDYSEVAVLTVPSQRWVWDCAFTLDSQFIFTCSSDNFLRLWRCEGGPPVYEYTGHQRAVTALAFRDTRFHG
ncbi:target of rapamycin complex subunit lst8 [Trichuris trichiura]|uniref:Target of rapamycin complex subunit lst8 n=1 Tax=Trichuris trichiura TaxID=36087 RepID=A0A077YVX8_TRITR|nr:target of rapamycin complex subunit lst8 [Trichuris trichiura]